MKLSQVLAHALLVPMEGHPNSPACVWGLPIHAIGSPGIGKSTCVRDAAHAAGLPMEPVYAATRQPEDFSGALLPNGEIECILGGARKLINEGCGVLFLDEISCARPAVQAALLSVVLERRIGDTLLPSRVRIVAASNPPEEAAAGWELEPPMANRLAHFKVEIPTNAEWRDWLTGRASSDVSLIEDGEKRIAEGWTGAWSYIVNLADKFMAKMEHKTLYNMPPEGSKERGGAWPTPRAWVMALRAHATCTILNSDKKDRGLGMTRELMTACIGAGACGSYLNYIKELDLPDPLEALTKGFVHDPKRIDRTLAIYNSMVPYITGCSDTKEKIRLAVFAWKRFMEGCNNKNADTVMFAAKSLTNAGLGRSRCEELEKASSPVLLFLANNGFAQYVV